MSEQKYEARDMEAMAKVLLSAIGASADRGKCAAMLRQGAAAESRWSALEAWRLIRLQDAQHDTNDTLSDTRKSGYEGRAFAYEAIGREMARLEKERTA